MVNGVGKNMCMQKRGLSALLIALVIAFVFITYWRGKIFDFFYRFFIKTIGWGYNPVNTVVYSLILVISIFMVAHLLEKLKVEPDAKFVLSALPYIIIGSSSRALRDLGFLKSIVFVSPLIFFLVFAYTLPCLMLSLFAGKKTDKPFQVFFLIFGSAPASYLVYQIVINVEELRGASTILLYTIASALIALILIYFINRLVTLDEPLLNYSIIVAHLLDASATYVAVTYYGYGEQHVLTNFFTSLFGTIAILFPLKILIVLPVLLLLDHYAGKEEATLKGTLKLVLLILGLATGLRDLFRLAMLT